MAFTCAQGVLFKLPTKPVSCDKISLVVHHKNSFGRKNRKLSKTTTVIVTGDCKIDKANCLLGGTTLGALVPTNSLVSTKNREERKKTKHTLNKGFSWGAGSQKRKPETPISTTVKCYHDQGESENTKSSKLCESQESLKGAKKATTPLHTNSNPLKSKKIRSTAATSRKPNSQSKAWNIKKKVHKEQTSRNSQVVKAAQEEDESYKKSYNNGHAQFLFSDGYIHAIDKSRLLSQEEEAELANYLKKQTRLIDIQQRMMQKFGRKLSLEEWAIRAGMSVQDLHDAIILGNNAKEKLITANLRLVHSIASRFAHDSNKNFHKPVQLVDLIQEGILGLIQATDKFDPSYGWRFSTFATWWIRASISKYLNEYNRSVRVPAKVLALFNQSKKVAVELESKKKVPSESEVCSLLGVSSSRLRFCIEAVTNQPVSLERLGELLEDSGRLGKGAVYCVADSRECTEENLAECLLRADLFKVLQEYLCPMETRALLLRYGLRDGQFRSLEECGRIMSCSRERVRQLLLSGITKLRNSTVESCLKDYLQ
ncbi:RNA polymerase sigma factor SigA [Galdieria sulphuraria]|uniref:RNA polymerase primary sigma factor n=1 Tax=Galdieria sulphuraria TaxID=130081 RepID=M2XG09_GALSU|nr:RNA polymerase primary sigma factor [Galdieria sulphuraria]EME28967.1 RNA polymerase primary sigma factor [Galdieria sulphuraria]GJD06905.1 RNA polymerase sigma factor SigA [Galdieria sulphuraria]|eukprot:XP_005705487.1 RNA polymerase primary sigma factor [Galdieria sulphuraria]